VILFPPLLLLLPPPIIVRALLLSSCVQNVLQTSLTLFRQTQFFVASAVTNAAGVTLAAAASDNMLI